MVFQLALPIGLAHLMRRATALAQRQ